MRQMVYTAMTSLAAILACLIVTPGLASAESCLQKLKGRRVIVIMKDGTVVRGWLLKVSPKKILVRRDNNTYIRTSISDVGTVRRVSPTPGSYGPKSQPVDCRPGPIDKPFRILSKPSRGRAIALKQVASADRLRKIGKGLTIGGLCLGGLGTGLVVGAIFLFNPSLWVVGLSLAVVGGVVAVIGTPLWIVGSTRVKRAREHLKQYPSNYLPLDPVHERRMLSNLRHGQLRTPVFRWTLVF